MVTIFSRFIEFYFHVLSSFLNKFSSSNFKMHSLEKSFLDGTSFMFLIGAFPKRKVPDHYSG